MLDDRVYKASLDNNKTSAALLKTVTGTERKHNILNGLRKDYLEKTGSNFPKKHFCGIQIDKKHGFGEYTAMHSKHDAVFKKPSGEFTYFKDAELRNKFLSSKEFKVPGRHNALYNTGFGSAYGASSKQPKFKP